ncbi:hypothetical protein Syun_029405 [Stephania yunnanensis]|uniref:Alliinase n=1 Tax=Stephania yunnanensis TaxID=152371 RepID=A0AAP0E5K1_9MAGN
MKIHIRGLPMMWASLLILSMIVLNTVPMTCGDEHNELKWSRAAAEEAEAVASIKCSGHGRASLDGLPIEGKPACQCNSCYSGDDCSVLLPNCAVDSGSAMVVSGWHRMGYSYEDGSYISRELEKVIRRLHEVVGNANTKGKYILFGAGSTQLLNAAIVGLSLKPPQNYTGNHSFSPANVVASIPFYQVYKQQTDIYNSLSFKWKGDASLWKNNSDSTENFIEFVTSPNNPDGRIMEPVLKGSSVKTIYDYAYYWPHYTGISTPVDTELMIFTISKLTGHAGSRFGWAFVKDRALYERMENYLDVNSIGSSHDTQLRALVLLKSVLKDKARGLFEFGHAYGWLKCERKEDGDCPAVLRAAGVMGRNGSVFHASNKYVRLSLIRSQDDFDLLLRKIDALVSQE